jgi:tetratricopeptide (TPR) repeat protein
VRRGALGLALSAALALGTNTARAEDAEALVTRGLELRLQGKDGQALELFRRADQIAPSPRTRAQVALAEQALGIWVAAEGHLAAALAAKDDAWIEKNRVALSAALEIVRQHLGQLEVLGGAPGAEVYVDGARIGVLPMSAPWRVEVGRRSLEVRAPGYHSASRTTEIVAGGTTRETIGLVKEDAAAARPAGAGGVMQPDGGAVQRTLGWAAVGTVSPRCCVG